MKLPKEFKYRAVGVWGQVSSTVCDAKLTSAGVYMISRPGVPSLTYTVGMVSHNVDKGYWEILAESFPDLKAAAQRLQGLVVARKDASELTVDEVDALRLTRGLINRLLCDR